MRRMVQSGKSFSFYCTGCKWEFNPKDQPPDGETIEEMSDNFLKQRDAEFTKHRCEENR